jgi:hypothetical protein
MKQFEENDESILSLTAAYLETEPDEFVFVVSSRHVRTVDFHRVLSSFS